VKTIAEEIVGTAKSKALNDEFESKAKRAERSRREFEDGETLPGLERSYRQHGSNEDLEMIGER
jgi:hypothetical protein